MFIGYFPQEWIIFLNIGALCAVLLGVFLGMRNDIRPFKDLMILLVMIFSILVSSILFYSHYLHEFADNGETYPEPLYGCPDLQKYLETTPAFRNPSPSIWKEIIEQLECRSGAIATILVSSALAWGSTFLLSAFLCLMLRSGLNRVRTPTMQEEIVTDTLIAPSSSDIYPDVPVEYTVASLDGNDEAMALIERIFRNICIGDEKKLDGWDGHIFREFIIQGFKSNPEKKKLFKEGFNVQNDKSSKKVNILWSSFLGIKNRAPSKETTIEILEWKAMCDKTPLQSLLKKFVVYCANKSNRWNNPEFFKDVIPITDKPKSEL